MSSWITPCRRSRRRSGSASSSCLRMSAMESIVGFATVVVLLCSCEDLREDGTVVLFQLSGSSPLLRTPRPWTSTCVLLAERFHRDSLSAWRKEYSADNGAVERVMNHVHLADLFHQLPAEETRAKALL